MKNRRKSHSTTPVAREANPHICAYMRSLGLDPLRVLRGSVSELGYWEFEIDVNGRNLSGTRKEWPEGFDRDEFQDAMRKDGFRL